MTDTIVARIRPAPVKRVNPVSTGRSARAFGARAPTSWALRKALAFNVVHVRPDSQRVRPVTRCQMLANSACHAFKAFVGSKVRLEIPAKTGETVYILPFALATESAVQQRLKASRAQRLSTAIRARAAI